MKTRTFLLLTSLSLLGAVLPAGAQGTAFTYQGRLMEGGNPANGAFDLSFALYNSPAAPGSLVAGPVTNSGVAVVNGLFAVNVDFGPGVFTGPSYWLELGVRTAGAGDFTTLSGRQPIAAVPYALLAGASITAGTANSVVAGAVTGAGIAPSAITSSNIASGQVVKSLNGLADEVTLAAGPNIFLTTNGLTLTLAATGGFTLPDTYTNAVNINNPGNRFTGDGRGLSNLNVSSIVGLRIFGPLDSPDLVGGAGANTIIANAGGGQRHRGGRLG